MSALAAALLADLDDAAMQALADRLRPFLAEPLGRDETASPWLNAEEAARYLACSRGRLYDLVQVRKLNAHRDGRRLLFRRSDLDSYLEAAT